MLEKHEKQIARHTAIQSQIAGWQLFIGAATTAALIYLAYQQYLSAERQVTLEYAKVAPQFEVNSVLFPTEKSSAVDRSFPKDINLRIRRGEAVVNNVQIIQEIYLSRLITGKSSQDSTCIFRISNYLENRIGSTTEFSVSSAAKRFPLDPVWHQDRQMRDFVIFNPQNTLVKIDYSDIFTEKRTVRFTGFDGKFDQIPSGDFGKPSIYETVDVQMEDQPIRVPGIFKLIGDQPTTRGCRSLLGLSGGKDRFY